MRLILKTDIELWGQSTVDSIGNLPAVVSNLVRATTPIDTYNNFPAEKSVFSGDFDGVVICSEKREFVPEGTSLWELATNISEGIQAKANRDYKKRTNNPGDYEIGKCTYIFVTTTHWPGLNKWVIARNKEKKWKEVKAFDSNMLEQWFQLTPPVTKWFAKLTKKPGDFHHIQLCEEYWNEWAQGPKKIKLLPESVTAGRDAECASLMEFFRGEPRIYAVKAASKEEAIAFIVAAAMLFDNENRASFFAKSVIVNNVEHFRHFSETYKYPLILISKVDGTIPDHRAVSLGHHVLLPLAPDDPYNSADFITLPKIDKDGLTNSLVKIGIDPDTASSHVKESAGDITILRRLLKFSLSKLKWTKPKNAREIIPAMFLGRWNINMPGDMELLTELAQEPAEDYLLKLEKWKDIVFLQIGPTWRLTSPLDAWSNLSASVTSKDLDNLAKAFLKVFTYNDAYYGLNYIDRMLAPHNEIRVNFSTWAREGLSQSLILVGLHGKSLKVANLSSPQLWVDSVVSSLFLKIDRRLWPLLNYQMPLIAEASPGGFMKALEKTLSQKNPEVLEMFKEDLSGVTPASHHTGLLWALEGLAWIPDYIAQSSLILSRLAEIDPGGSLSNRPKNSLYEIFKPWKYETLANLDERLAVLKLIGKKTPRIAWGLLKKLLPHEGVGHRTYRMRWRMFNATFPIQTREDYYATHSAIIDILFEIYDYSGTELSELIHISTNKRLPELVRKKVFNFVEKNYSKTKLDKHMALDQLRNTLARHRSFQSEVEWALPEKELVNYEKLYLRFQPKNVVEKNIWMFNDSFPQFPEGYKRTDRNLNQQQDLIQKKRIAALSEVYQKFGIKEIIKLSATVKFKWPFGDSLAHQKINDSDTLIVLKTLNNQTTELDFVYSFIRAKILLSGINWLKLWHKNLVSEKVSEVIISRLFIPAPQSKELWQYLSKLNKNIQNLYWLYMQPGFMYLNNEEKITGIKSLIKACRFVTALRECNFIKEEIPTELIITVLQKAAREKSLEDAKIEGYEVSGLFEELDRREDVNEQDMVNLELAYLSILSSYGTRRKPKRLHDELNSNPAFFVDTLKLLFIPKNTKLLAKEREGLTEEQVKIFATRAYELFQSWKGIPGVNTDGEVDGKKLKSWVRKVRTLAAKIGRKEVADMKVGEILARYDERAIDWAPEILEIIETVNSDSLNRNFSSGIFNLRGHSSRGPFDGGDIERAHANHFKTLEEKYRNTYPKTALIFKELSLAYFEDAKFMDQRADRDKLDN